ncbi:ABC transporter ATP-binding protein/permease [Rhodoblastus sp.]|uniref:ABC transporter ATP-binding protein/permease n=1 Tax=Rhodoblastus sp. TaxID=1962975 RepID=UPI0026059769|nr:ABC transporter ATP-binding protein/permease [Rhodoblastus sp.]
MAEVPDDARQVPADGESSREGIVEQSRAFLRTLRQSPQRGALLALAGALIVVVAATAASQIWLNVWTKAFYDSLSDRNMASFLRQLSLYVVIAGLLLVLNVAQMWLNLTMKMKLREALTRDLIAQWLTPRRAFLIADAGAIGVNPDQRIHQDAQHLAELSTDLAIGLLQAALLLVSFIGVLWALSSDVVFNLGGRRFHIPGYMVWSVLLYSGVASFVSWRTGGRLIPLNAEHYARESNLRFALVHAGIHSEGIAVYRGEAEEKGRLNEELDRLLVILRGLVSVTTRLTWVTAGYGWFTIVAPIIVASPAYFSGELTLGGLLMAVGAFGQVQSSLRWFVDNFGNIADWRATLLRVESFRSALQAMDRLGGGASRIALVVGVEGRLRFDCLRVLSPIGDVTLEAPDVTIGPGERVLISGAPGAGKTSLFRAIAGLWSWGSGRIELPSDDEIMFMPKRPYIPDGSLRTVLAYPAAPGRFTPEDYAAALRRMGLDHLVAKLDEVARWDRELTDVEQQALAFARLPLHKPRWLIVDSAMNSLPVRAREAVLDLLRTELAATALVNISVPQGDEGSYTRVLRLVRNAQGECLAYPGGP